MISAITFEKWDKIQNPRAMQKILLIYAITFFLSLTNYPEATQIQFEPQLSLEDLIPNQLGFKQPDYEGDAPSGRDRGTGSRGDCPLADAGRKGELELIPLIPTDSRGLTTKASPTLWVEVSYSSNQRAKELFGELSVEDAQTCYFYKYYSIYFLLVNNSNSFLSLF